MGAAWQWIKKWGGVLFGGIATLLLLIIGGGWLWRKKKTEIGKLQDALAVSEALKEIEKLRAVRVEIVALVGEKDEAIKVIDRRLLENQREIVEAYEGTEDLDDEEMLAELTRLGY